MRFSMMLSVYNPGAYFQPCLDSVLRQTCGDFEVILVDDGSTDGSGRVCDSYAERDRRVRVFHTENRGVFAARQFAEAHARGDYLLHFDADDLVEPTLLEKLSEAINVCHPDLLFYDFSTFRGDAPPVYEGFLPQSGKVEDLTVLYGFLLTTRFNTLCNKCFSRRLIECAPDYERFAKLRHGEDLLRSAHLVFGAESAYYIAESFYSYRLGVGHASRFDRDSLNRSDVVMQEIRRLLCRKIELTPPWEREYCSMCRKQFDNYLRLLAASDLPIRQCTDILREAAETTLYKNAETVFPSGIKYRLLRQKRYCTLLCLQRGKGWLHAQ